jgi:hypothetical protein
MSHTSIATVQNFRAQWRCCHGFGHVQDVCICPQAYILQDGGVYISASNVKDIDEGVVISDPFEDNEVDYVLANEEDPSPCEISELATRSAPKVSENKSKGNEKGDALRQCENSFDEQKFSIDHPIVEKLLVESFNIFHLLQDDFLVLLCDKEELCEINSCNLMPQLVHVNYTHALEPYTSAENKVFIPIRSALDEKIIVLTKYFGLYFV